MSNEPIEMPSFGVEGSTFHCPHCGCDIAIANQLTHEVACARMQRNRDQRPPMAQPIARQSSSSAIAEPVNEVQSRPQIMPRREERRVVENKLVTCPNCEKSVREQEINNHLDNECLKNEVIPCEFCDEAIPMSDYSQHVESCPRRAQNQQNNRDRSPIRERPQPERSQSPVRVEEEEESDDIPHEEPNERDRSPERGSSQGGIRGFFRNLVDSAGTHIRTYTENLQREAEEREQARLEHERRQRERQEEMLRYMFGQPRPQPQVPRNPSANQNALVPATRVVRTVEQGPGGMLIVRSRVVPVNQLQGLQQGMPSGPMQVGMNPLELLFGMMNGGMGGMQAIGNGEAMGQPPEERGLDKETINSLAVVKYNKEMNKNLDEESKKCPICLDQFEEGQDLRFLWCLHRFHKDCVDPWLDKHTNCPLCKKDFSEAEHNFAS